MKKLAIIGAGGHGKVIADAAERSNLYDEIIFLDDNKTIGEDISGFIIKGNANQAITLKETHEFIVGIGDNSLRSKIQENLELNDLKIATIIHPSAIIGKNVTIHKGTVIMAGVVINIDTTIGKGCIINTASVIEHDNIIHNYVHISPNASLAGNVNVGEKTWIGIGASVIQNITIENNVVVGGGSLVINNTTSNKRVIGSPARET